MTAAEHGGKRFRHGVESLHYMLGQADGASFDQIADLTPEIGVHAALIEQAAIGLDGERARHDGQQYLWQPVPGVTAAVAIIGHQAANQYLSAIFHSGQRLWEQFAADILEIDIAAAGCRRLKLLFEIRRIAIERGIKAQFVGQVASLLRARGQPDHPQSAPLTQLSDYRPN